VTILEIAVLTPFLQRVCILVTRLYLLLIARFVTLQILKNSFKKWNTKRNNPSEIAYSEEVEPLSTKTPRPAIGEVFLVVKIKVLIFASVIG
jgi:hypothetical protein